MPRHTSYYTALKREQSARESAQRRAASAVVKARKAAERAKVLDQKLRAKMYAESRVNEVAQDNKELVEKVAKLGTLLSDAVGTQNAFDVAKIKRSIEVPTLNLTPEMQKTEEAPVIQTFLPPELSWAQKLVPGAKAKHDSAIDRATQRHRLAIVAYLEREKARKEKIEEANFEFEKKNSDYESVIAELDQLRADFSKGLPDAITGYFMLVLQTSSYPEGFPQKAKVAYVPQSKQLVVEYEYPSFEVVPGVGDYKYVAKTDQITSKPRSEKERKNIYSALVAQLTLRTLHELFAADVHQHIDTLVLNGMVSTIDKGTGHAVRPCVVTVRTTRDVFIDLDLSKVDPAACLKVLSASVSKSPAELEPVRPVLEFNMVDPRFIQETDVLSTLDNRPNLMELTPSEFESLITNLFEKMGLETRLTQASRDGGVDCVAFDPRPIFGGKVVIQAKRYKHTVGVSATRDLFGTMQNEGASKGILVTTSGFGKASFEFANGKPIELLDGSNLLYLLAEHAGVEAKIEPPETWKDTEADASNEALFNPNSAN